MKTSVIVLAGAIVLSGCTAMGLHKSEGATTENMVASESHPRELDKGSRPLDPAREQRIRAINILEKSIQESLPSRSQFKIDSLVIISNEGHNHTTQYVMSADGETVPMVLTDQVCTDAFPVMPPRKERPKAVKMSKQLKNDYHWLRHYYCSCDERQSDSDGIHEKSHFHCWLMPIY